jgi:hypothetical protein
MPPRSRHAVSSSALQREGYRLPFVQTPHHHYRATAVIVRIMSKSSLEGAHINALHKPVTFLGHGFLDKSVLDAVSFKWNVSHTLMSIAIICIGKCLVATLTLPSLMLIPLVYPLVLAKIRLICASVATFVAFEHFSIVLIHMLFCWGLSAVILVLGVAVLTQRAWRLKNLTANITFESCMVVLITTNRLMRFQSLLVPQFLATVLACFTN